MFCDLHICSDDFNGYTKITSKTAIQSIATNSNFVYELLASFNNQSIINIKKHILGTFFSKYQKNQ